MIKQAKINDCTLVAQLASKLWNNHAVTDLEEEFKEYLVSDKFCIYIYYDNNLPVAFIQCSLRYDYVEGTNTSPVGYLEGIYVKEQYRFKGIAKELLDEFEKWAKKNNCMEIASDCEINNKTSYLFHLKCGFTEANKIICFTKKL